MCEPLIVNIPAALWQAAEPIVDFALESNTPFAVVLSSPIAVGYRCRPSPSSIAVGRSCHPSPLAIAVGGCRRPSPSAISVGHLRCASRSFDPPFRTLLILSTPSTLKARAPDGRPAPPCFAKTDRRLFRTEHRLRPAEAHLQLNRRYPSASCSIPQRPLTSLRAYAV